MTFRLRAWPTLASLVVGAVIVLLAALVWSGDGGPRRAAPLPSASPSPSPSPSSTPPEPEAVTPVVPKRRAGCATTAREAFVPARVRVPGVGARDVVGLPRDASGTTGVPPVSTEGKSQFAWDAPGVRPGSSRGNVLLNAHTWPDGSALGNQLLEVLDRGDVIAVLGAEGQRLCYRVTDRVQVPFDAPGDRYYDAAGPAQVAIVVCSGTRLGPGAWTHRTLWFGTPVAPAA